MSTINSKNVQVGTSNVAAENFTLYQPSTPDGTVRLGVGNSGATTADVVTVNSAGVTVTGSVAATTGTFSGAVQASGVTTNLYPLVSGTAVASTSGTSIDFTSIPSWVKNITVMFNGVSGSGSSDFLFQLGDSGGIETTGYLGAGSVVGASVTTTNYTAGFGFAGGGVTAKVWQGAIRFANITGNTWVADGVFARSDGANTALVAGGKSLTDVLDRVRITHVNGTDTFDAGTINIFYE
jgi:hypothetical protein